MKPVEVEILMKDRLSGALDKAGRKVDELKGKATAASSEMDSQAQRLRTAIAGLTEQMEELRRVGQNASPNLDQSENMAGIEALEKQIAELESRLKQLDATAEATQTVPPELPAAKQQFNGLHMSIQQMAREMPSLAMGPQMFFLAISNNLPIFADEVKRARVEYDNLVKSGQKGVPVWKQILSSLFSWQTALTTGIMLLVMYGDEIIEWTKNLFSSKDGVDALKKALQEKNEVEKEGHAVSIRTRAELDNTLRELRDFIGTKEQEKNKVDELNRKYGDTFGTYKSLTEWYDTLIQKGNAYVESLFMQAKAQSYIKKAIEADEKANEIRSKGKEEYRPFWGAGGKLNMFFGGDNIGQYGSDPAETAFNKALQEEENKKQHYLNEVEWFQKEATRIFKEAGLSDYRTIETDDDTAKTEEEKRKQARRKLNDELLALEQQNQQDWLDLQEEGTQKKLARIDADYARQKAEIEKKVRELAELNRKAGITGTNAAGLTGEQQTEIDRANTLAEDTREKERTAVYREEAVAMRDYLKEYGSYQQQKLAIAEEYAEKIRRAQSEGERLSLEKERDSAVNRLELSAIRQQIDWGNVFGNFGVMFREQVQPTIDRLKTIARSPEFQTSADVNEMEALYGLISSLQQSETMWNGEPISLYTTGSLSALGLGNLEGGGGGGGGLIKLVHGFDDLGGAFDNATLTDTFNAYTINEIWKLANAGASTIGTGNVVTAVSKTALGIVVTKGITLYDWVRQPNKPTYSLSEINNVSGTYTGLTVGRAVESDNAKKLNGLDNGAFLYKRGGMYETATGNGWLIRTKVEEAEAAMLTLHLIGNGYYSRRIINTIVQAYNYAPNDVEFTATAGTHFGDDLGDVKVFLYGGHVCFWVSAKTDYQTCSIFVYNTYGALNGTCENCVESISLSPMPAVGVSKLTVVTPSVALTDNDSIAADRLKNIRTIWGNPFDGSNDVSGSLSGVRDITMEGDIDGANVIRATSINLSTGSKSVSISAGRIVATNNIRSKESVTSDGNITAGGDISSQGNISAQGSVTALTTSDERLKRDFDYTRSYTDRLLAMGRVCDFRYTEKARKRNKGGVDGEAHTGLLYQKVKEVLPSMAYETEDGYGALNYLSPDYINTIAGATQETARLVKALKKEVERLKKELSELKGKGGK